MIRLYRISLPDMQAQQLADLTANIDERVPSEQLAEARRLWQGRPQVRGNIRSALQRFASGRSRCMYCGDNQGSDVDHYEPLVNAPRRAFDWLNHLLACSSCNSHFKRDQFPFAPDDTPLLIDPTTDDPFEHLALALSVGRYAALTERGDATIRICQLNRDILCRGRQVAYETITILLDTWQRAYESEDHRKMASVEHTVREQPFADVIHAMLRYVESPGAKDLFSDRLHIVPILAGEHLKAKLFT